MHLIEEWKEGWRYFSVWYVGAAFALLSTWAMLPYQIRPYIPDWIELTISVLLFVGYCYVRFIAQPKTKAKIEAKLAAKKASQNVAA